MKSRRNFEWAGAVMLLAALGLLLAPTLKLFGAVGVLPDASTQNLTQLGLAFIQYAQDYDEKLPAATTQAGLQADLQPYVSSPSVFVSPATGQPYVFNSALSGHGVYEYSDPGTVELAQEDPPPANQPAAVLFLDGHVERGGVEVGDPGDIVVSRAKMLALGVIQYEQDADEKFPPMHTPQEFQTAVLPYVRATRCFYTPSGAAFVPNPALSGVSLAAVNSPVTTVLLSEPPPYTGGLDTVAYADGHVTRGGIVPETIVGASNDVQSRARQLGLAVTQYTQDYDETYPPMQNAQVFQAALLPYVTNAQLFYTPRGSPFVPNPALSGASLASLADPSTTVEFQDAPPYVNGNPTLCYADGHVSHQGPVVVNPGLPVPPKLLWDNSDGRIALWTLDGSGGFTQNQYGPFPGWTAQALATGPDQVPRLLWTKPDGTISTWAVAAGDGYTHQEYGPYSGWTAQGLAVGADNAAHLLWTNTTGQLSLWNIAAAGTVAHQEYGPYPQWTARALSVDPVDHTHILWTRTDGMVSLWDLEATGVPAIRTFGPYPGWSAVALASGPDGYSHLLWNRTDKVLSLWTTGTDGTFGHQEYGPYPGWTAKELTVGADNKMRVLWSSTSGQTSLWSVDALGGFSFNSYGPYPDWTAQSLGAGW